MSKDDLIINGTNYTELFDNLTIKFNQTADVANAKLAAIFRNELLPHNIQKDAGKQFDLIIIEQLSSKLDSPHKQLNREGLTEIITTALDNIGIKFDANKLKQLVAEIDKTSTRETLGKWTGQVNRESISRLKQIADGTETGTSR